MIFKLIKKHFFNNKTLFIVFILCQIISLFVALFVFNLIEIKFKMEEQGNLKYRTMYISFDEEDDSVKTVKSILSNDVCDKIETITGTTFFDKTQIKILIYSIKDVNEVIDAGRKITKEEINTQKKVALANPATVLNNKVVKIGDEFTLHEIKYEIIGLSSTIKGIHIVGNDDINKDLNRIEVVHKNDIKSIEDFILNLGKFVNTNNITPPLDNNNEKSIVTGEFIVIVLALALININFFSIYYFILEKDKKTYSIFKICGCNKKRASLFLYGELLLVSFISYLFAMIIFNIFATEIFKFMNEAIVYKFSFKANALSLSAYIVSLMAIAIPKISIYNRSSIHSLYQRSDME